MHEVRRYTWKLYPTKPQEVALHEQRKMMADLWNALLQRHEDIYRRTRGQRHVVHCETPKKTPTFFDMTNEITKLRHASPEWENLSVWCAHRVAKSIELAFQAFYRRVKEGAGAQSGYPRFKRRDLNMRIPHRCVSGCRLTPTASERSDDGCGPSARNWRLKVKGVEGAIRARGELPAAALKWTDADIIFRDGTWWFSVAVEMAPRRNPGADKIMVRFDLIDEFARVERADGRRTASVGSARVPAGSSNHLNKLHGGHEQT